MLVENVGGPQGGDHVEESELMLMDQCTYRDGSRKKVEGWGWSAGVEALESL